MEYYKTDEKSLRNFITELEFTLEQGDINNMEQFNENMKEIANKTLKTTYRRRIGNKGEVKEASWVNESIRQGIKKRRYYNRLRRYAENKEEEDKYEELYLKQKDKVQGEIKRTIYAHESMVSREVTEGGDSSRKMWIYINKLRNKNTEQVKELKMYNEQGIELNKEETE
ncbi:hypothetical protein Pcinc_017182 [Petrolisthes cinctipes]|uniref:Uncharacterized protein n=1 Tax=Petrolisthes cinctipes TaxID=88211 RepID=A0AAE1FPL1_PETCI|nr:hypothetical protein Pcinc_017182 [Petrolisthes cinctipes]